MSRVCTLCVLSLVLGFVGAATAADFAIRDGDTVVFMGDSITAARTYGKIIETYTLLRYPDRKVKFVNVGQGGDTAAGGLKRLQRDVFDRGATLLTVAFGINDIGWGMKADDEHRKLYLDSIRGIVEECKKHNVRVFICSAAATGENPETAEKGYLKKMCDEGMAISKSLGEGAIDVHGMMHASQKKIWAHNAKVTKEKDKITLHAEDGIHLNEQGQMVMAFAILKGLGAPAEVSSASLDAKAAKLIDANGCKISDIKSDGKQFEFTRLDEGLPITFGLIGVLSYWHTPYPEELNRYMLTVKNLPEGSYDIVADERLVGTYSRQQLNDGVNLGCATPDAWVPGGPWDSQCTVLRSLTDARDQLVYGGKLTDTFMPRSPSTPEIHKQVGEIDAKIIQLQHQTARPTPYHFIIRPAAKKEGKK